MKGDLGSYGCFPVILLAVALFLFLQFSIPADEHDPQHSELDPTHKEKGVSCLMLRCRFKTAAPVLESMKVSS